MCKCPGVFLECPHPVLSLPSSKVGDEKKPEPWGLTRPGRVHVISISALPLWPHHLSYLGSPLGSHPLKVVKEQEGEELTAAESWLCASPAPSPVTSHQLHEAESMAVPI
jgi:hypothetical protein